MAKNRIRLYPWELDSMPEYSCSIPSGTVLWKMWRRNTLAYCLEVACTCGFRGRASVEARLVCPDCKGDLRKLPYREDWIVGQYVPCDIPGQIGIRWYEVQVLSGPKPRCYTPPDWDNYKRWKADRAAERAAEATAASPGPSAMAP
jgi:hypothetical protein